MPMLAFLRGKVSDRKLRLLAVACCRVVWDSIQDRGKNAIEAAEIYADGLLDETELNRVYFWAQAVGMGKTVGIIGGRLVVRDHGSLIQRRLDMAAQSANSHKPFLMSAFRNIFRDPDLVNTTPLILRCVFGNPFRPISVDPAWLTSTVIGLAQGIYDERAFDRLPILADALQDAGCHSEDMLGHCRSGGPHTRGCWAADAILKFQ